MKRKFLMVLVILAAITFCSALRIQPAEAMGIMYIQTDGSISPSEAPIRTLDKITYTLTANAIASIIVQRSNVVIDGASHTLQGDGTQNGFVLQDVVNITIKNTLIRDCFDGIQLFNASDNTITGNTIIGSSYEGVGVYYSSGNVLAGNNVTNNQIGIAFYSSSSNSIVHNVIISNVYQVYTESTTNNWDNGYPSGGNYWSDYNGTDFFKGPDQNQTGSDGIGDTPYTIDVNNVDNCPLTKPYGGFHDIGLIKGLMTKTAISQGKDLNVTIIIINYGFTTETSNITAYFDTTQLVQTQITLTSRNSTALKFVLNTTDLARGNHTITAYVDPVPGETAATDNTLHSLVIITFQGDINGDGRVDMKDVSFVAKRFGLDPSKPNWDTSADINDDGRVDMKDISAVAKNFGKSGP